MRYNKHLIVLLLLLSLNLSAFAQKSKIKQEADKKYSIVFYNVENLFDIYDDPNTYDEEFTPTAPKAWNEQKYNKKLSNLEEVFYNIAAANKSFPCIIGVSEIENRRVLDDLASMPKLLKANYQIIHYDSPDARGVDVGLFYRPDVFKYEGSKPIKTKIEGEPKFRTRDILSVWGTIDGEKFYFFVCHWPSRRGGQYGSEHLRMGAAKIVRNAVDSIYKAEPKAKIVIMGDMNDDPIDKSLSEVLVAKEKIQDLRPNDLFNPFYAMLKAGYGSLAYKDSWNLFDNMVVNYNLLNEGALRLSKDKGAKFYGNIFNRPFLLQQQGQFKNYPLRTYVGDDFTGGYSDHLPVYLIISK